MAEPDDLIYTEIKILLDGRWEDGNEEILEDLCDFLHDKVCGRDHGPNGDQGVCAKDFMLSGRIVTDAELEKENTP